ncbi:hypothetical protein HPB50_021971 [Hyalomma asiaticum]|uniref:Uncharacterized protein n=1 Tax=Hyalomma asiaticum TaxID=266040 RepID=A0ACB7TP43_HYAAI|nr:hypothetical protein HPB50_021971 [Hyalomma asiaticum]
MHTDVPQLLVSLGEAARETSGRRRRASVSPLRPTSPLLAAIKAVAEARAYRKPIITPPVMRTRSAIFFLFRMPKICSAGPSPRSRRARALRRSAAIKALLRQVGAAGRRHDLWLLMTEANGRGHMTASGRPRRRAAGQRRPKATARISALDGVTTRPRVGTSRSVAVRARVAKAVWPSLRHIHSATQFISCGTAIMDVLLEL